MFVTEMFDTALSIKCESREYLSFNDMYLWRHNIRYGYVETGGLCCL